MHTLTSTLTWLHMPLTWCSLLPLLDSQLPPWQILPLQLQWWLQLQRATAKTQVSRIWGWRPGNMQRPWGFDISFPGACSLLRMDNNSPSSSPLAHLQAWLESGQLLLFKRPVSISRDDPHWLALPHSFLSATYSVDLRTEGLIQLPVSFLQGCSVLIIKLFCCHQGENILNPNNMCWLKKSVRGETQQLMWNPWLLEHLEFDPGQSDRPVSPTLSAAASLAVLCMCLTLNTVWKITNYIETWKLKKLSLGLVSIKMMFLLCCQRYSFNPMNFFHHRGLLLLPLLQNWFEFKCGISDLRQGSFLL